MKKIIVIALLCCAPFARVKAGEPVPAVSIRQAIEIAEREKTVRPDSDRVFIASVELQRVSMLNARQVWIVKWSGPLAANKPQDRDIGLQIFMDGSVKHIVKGPNDKPGR
jgi:hypothetical protein